MFRMIISGMRSATCFEKRQASGDSYGFVEFQGRQVGPWSAIYGNRKRSFIKRMKK